MQMDFHYYATYCAAVLAGYSPAESLELCYGAQLVDLCSVTFLTALKGPKAAATTQLQLELMKARTDLAGLQDITRIWSSFHFLPYDLYAEVKKASLRYKNKYRLICRPNGALVKDTVELAKAGGTLQAAGIAMHILADTWAHSYFAGTPSLVINNTDYYFYELLDTPEGEAERKLRFRHNPGTEDDLDQGIFTNSVSQGDENNIMVLGHGRAGHLPDYSFMRYRYLPTWGKYETVVKDNPAEYYHAFCQMVYALQYLRGEHPDFALDTYAWDTVKPLEAEIRRILETRQLDSCEDWRALGEKLSGVSPEDFDLEKYRQEYLAADSSGKDGTWLGAFFTAAMAQKSMVTNKIFTSGNLLAGFSVDFLEKGFRGIRDYRALVKQAAERGTSK